ncbi:MAG: hypothetical protein ABL900_05530 [Burkholderiaceae bacterium]
MAQGVTVVADPAAPPHSIVFSGPYDGNGDGINETTMTGQATFNSDPASTWAGLSGQVHLDVNIPILGELFSADVAFTITSSERQLSGSGTYTEPISGDTITMTVAAGTPLVVKPATGAPGAVSNACGYSLNGQMRLQSAGSAGTLTSFWNFTPDSPSVVVNGASFTDHAGQTVAMPDSTVDLRCGSNGSITDWVATFDQNYACLPRESGQARLTIAATGPDTITITDEDPPGSGSVNTYQATLVTANPHAVRGFFIAGPPGSNYREDFNWTLGKNGSGFSQVSTYTYIEGVNQGVAGICVASAKRLP